MTRLIIKEKNAFPADFRRSNTQITAEENLQKLSHSIRENLRETMILFLSSATGMPQRGMVISG
jgi:hypothetical protein